MVISLSLEMSLSRGEFLRLLPGALGLAPAERESGLFKGEDGPRRWTLRLLALPDRHLGSVVLPRHQVEISLEGFSHGEAEAFLSRFHRGFLRGGG